MPKPRLPQSFKTQQIQSNMKDPAAAATGHSVTNTPTRSEIIASSSRGTEEAKTVAISRKSTP